MNIEKRRAMKKKKTLLPFPSPKKYGLVNEHPINYGLSSLNQFAVRVKASFLAKKLSSHSTSHATATRAHTFSVSPTRFVGTFPVTATSGKMQRESTYHWISQFMVVPGYKEMATMIDHGICVHYFETSACVEDRT